MRENLRDVAVIGIGMTKFGNLGRVSSRELLVSASLEAMSDAGVSQKDIDAVYLGILSSDIFEHQMHLAPGIPDYLGLSNVPSTRVEAACASGGLAMMQSIMTVSGGFYDVVIAAGAEKMTNFSIADITDALAMCSDSIYELSLGVTFPGTFAMMARVHSTKYGSNAEQRAAVSVKNHKNAMLNPLAQYQKKITFEEAMNARTIADPLKLYDCAPVSDGAGAVVVVPWEHRNRYEGKAVKIRGFAQASDTMALHDRSDFTSFLTTKVAARNAFKMAKLEPRQIDFVEVHDCFTISEIMAIEDIGFFPKGTGGEATLSGETAKTGHLPVNVSGGLKAKGHPIGATGISQIIEVCRHLRGEAGARQVQDANIGMTHNLGGSGSTIVCHILERGD